MNHQIIMAVQAAEERCRKAFERVDQIALTNTAKVLDVMQRYQVASCLDSGMIYNEILAETGASSATISRVNRSLQYGNGGYAIVFERTKGDKA